MTLCPRIDDLADHAWSTSLPSRRPAASPRPRPAGRWSRACAPSGWLNDAPGRSPTARSPRGSCSRTRPRSRAAPPPASRRRRRRTAQRARGHNLARRGGGARAVHRRHALEDGDLVARDHLQRLPGSKRAAASATRRSHRGVHGEVWPKTWNSGSPPSTTSSSAEREQLQARSRRCRQVGVGQLGALGLAGRARGVEDHRGVVGLAIGDLGDRLGAVEHWSKAPARPAGLGARLGRALGAAPRIVPGEQQLGPGVTRGRRRPRAP